MPAAGSGDPPQAMQLFPERRRADAAADDERGRSCRSRRSRCRVPGRRLRGAPTGFTGALFTLPFGLRAFAEFSRKNQFDPRLGAAKLALQPARVRLRRRSSAASRFVPMPRPSTRPRARSSGAARCRWPTSPHRRRRPTGAGTLGTSVGEIFNNEFFFDGPTRSQAVGVPLDPHRLLGLRRQHLQPLAEPQRRHRGDQPGVLRRLRRPHRARGDPGSQPPLPVGHPGRAHDHAVSRASSAYVFRFDTGLAGRIRRRVRLPLHGVRPDGTNAVPQPNPYEFHPGDRRGAFNVRNIARPTTVRTSQPPGTRATASRTSTTTESSGPSTARRPANERSPEVDLQPVYFDADVEIDGVKSGGAGGPRAVQGHARVTSSSRRAASPSHRSCSPTCSTPSSARIGGPVDCVDRPRPAAGSSCAWPRST